ATTATVGANGVLDPSGVADHRSLQAPAAGLPEQPASLLQLPPVSSAGNTPPAPVASAIAPPRSARDLVFGQLGVQDE
ncbi:MAG: hypothetical protein ACREHD_02010, partial [Pirellulales bacterium]